ncbi:MAG: citrate (Si)-synthase [Dehalococcoidia bacterium]|nr:citrate (Si)-synthase [Dehalococcoidia bacterium]
MTEEQLARGLKGVVIDKTESSKIDGKLGKLIYHGYDIHDLAEKSTFEEVCYLLWHGKLPTQKELDDLSRSLAENRALPPQILQIIDLVKATHPMDALRTGVSALATFDPDTEDNSPAANLRKAIRLTAQTATIVAAHERIRKGQKAVAPDPSLNHAANFLYMLKGEKPDAESARAIDLDLLLHADHSSNASAFAARVTTGTNADMHAAIVSAIATLKGPAHGGAAQAVMTMTAEIGEPERAEQWVKDAIAAKKRVMGFGHRVYKTEDPRARHLRDRVRHMGEKYGQVKWFQILSRVEEAMAPYRERGIYVNVDFYAGAAYSLLGIPEDLFIPMFALGRMPGWITQILEQWADNILLRPLLKYVGPVDLPYIPISERK